MPNQDVNNSKVENESVDFPKNSAITSVEVLKDDAVISEESKKSDSNKEDKYSATIANIYQWAAKLKDDFKSEASDMTHEVSEKAAAMLLTKLLKGIDAELEGFDKQVEDSKNFVANAEEERKKIADKKEKYQGMIDQLES